MRHTQRRLPYDTRDERQRDTVRLKAFDQEGDCWHTISLATKACDCVAFDAKRGCEHLSALGLRRLSPFTPTARPTFSQALSALVKSLRIRRIEEAVYWLVYLDYFDSAQHRFRTARRLLIGSAEDGHSVAVMEAVAQAFRRMCKRQTGLTELVVEAVRICSLPNWWHSDSGGPDYIYSSLIGQRAWWYRHWDHTAATLRNDICSAVLRRDRATAVGGVMAFDSVSETFGATKQAEFLLQLAESIGHDLAARLCKVHLSARSALSSDNNFLCQAAWLMAGGVSPIAGQLRPVHIDDCRGLLEQAKERWKNPQPIPRWCLDGVHSAGDDPRFMGCLPEMWAVCRAFQHYGQVDPADEWLSEFQCYDGLVIEK